MRLENWTVDYGDGARAVELPHSWQFDMPVSWEGPAVYRTRVQVPAEPSRLLFHGVSYAADVRIDDAPLGTHLGMWDAFSFDLAPWAGKEVAVEVRVRKNGGATYPIRDVLSGFLPYVFNSFGGIYKQVEVVPAEQDWTLEPPPAPQPRLSVDRVELSLDGKPFYMRGVLSWGWYPELGHQNPSPRELEREFSAAKSLGFNTVKFCLWAPPHEAFEVLEKLGMVAWLELPLWDPVGDPSKLAAMGDEIVRIATQFRRHPEIVVWTVGCELHASTPAEYRAELVERVREITGSPMVKDNSGGAEMYGGDLREFGDFDDFHPYCETPFYPTVLESLQPGPRPQRPILLGEFNDFDVHRNQAEVFREDPYWSRLDEEVNPVGVRWQFDWPAIHQGRLWGEKNPELNRVLAKRSVEKGAYVRRKVLESVRSHHAIAGYVITGLRHTPISTSGVLDDHLEPVFSADQMAAWNGPSMLFLIPTRRPPFFRGGNRPGWLDTQNFFTGQVVFRVGLHSEVTHEDQLEWRLGSWSGIAPVARVEPLMPTQVAFISVDVPEPGEFELWCRFDGVEAKWPVHVEAAADWNSWENWKAYDPNSLLPELSVLPGRDRIIATDWSAEFAASDGILFPAPRDLEPMPFWRECVLDHSSELGFEDRYPLLWAISSEAGLREDASWLAEVSELRTLVNRVDTRTYRETPLVQEFETRQGGRWLVCAFRPWGGLGAQPTSLATNPAGVHLLRSLRRQVER